MHLLVDFLLEVLLVDSLSLGRLLVIEGPESSLVLALAVLHSAQMTDEGCFKLVLL